MNPEIRLNGANISSYVISCGKIPVVCRNRNWEPVAAGFRFNLSSASDITPAKDDIIELFIDNKEYYLGFVSECEYNYGNSYYEIDVANYLLKLEEKTVEYNTLHALLNNTAAFDSQGKQFTVDTSTGIFTCNNHGLDTKDNNRIQFKTNGGTLPSPLISNKYYWVTSIDDNTFKISKGYQDWSALPVKYLSIETGGTGNNLFAAADLFKYNDTDNESVRPNLTIKWLFEKVFETAGMHLDTSAVDNITTYSLIIDEVTYTFNWNEILVDENMLYNINQNIAADHSLLDDLTVTDYIKNKINLWKLVQVISGCFGFSLTYIGDISSKTYRLNSQIRDSSGFPEPGSELVYNIDGEDKIKYSSKFIQGSRKGYYYSGRWVGRQLYTSSTEQQLIERGIVRTQSGQESIGWLNNLVFLLRDKTPGSAPPYTKLPPEKANVLPSDGYLTYNYWFTGYALQNGIAAYENDFLREDIECPIILGLNTIKENRIDIENLTSAIIQEKKV